MVHLILYITYSMGHIAKLFQGSLYDPFKHPLLLTLSIRRCLPITSYHIHTNQKQLSVCFRAATIITFMLQRHACV